MFRIQALGTWLFTATLTLTSLSSVGLAAESRFASHPPERPLPQASDRPLGAGPAYYIDVANGRDANPGSRQQPWQSLKHAVSQLRPGDTLYLRGGIYREPLELNTQGQPQAWITIRSAPGELAVLDGGYAEFLEHPEDAWEPCPGGVPGEFQSTRTYEQLQAAYTGEIESAVTGQFADSLLPLHAYRRRDELASLTEISRTADGTHVPVYYGPGVWYNPASKRIHVRLSPTHVLLYGKSNYQGETDPRRLPLIVAPYRSQPVRVSHASHIRLQDLVIRGAGRSAVYVEDSDHVTLEHLTLYAGYRGVWAERSGHLRMLDCAVRGTMPPWGSRSVSKACALDSHQFVAVGTREIQRDKRKYFRPYCHDFEVAHCEFTDGHDGPYVGGVQRFRFHHNLVDNMNDDGVYLSAWGPPGSEVHIYENRLARCLQIFAFGLGRSSASDPGTTNWIYRNVIDLTQPVRYSHPRADDPNAVPNYGQQNNDHGGPVWEPIHFYHNTVVNRNGAWRDYYGLGWGRSLNEPRAMVNNIFVQQARLPGTDFSSSTTELVIDGNLHWTLDPDLNADTFWKKLRTNRTLLARSDGLAATADAHGLYADPQLKNLGFAPGAVADFRLRSGSPAVNAGVPLDPAWPDPLADRDSAAPDIGALPLGVELIVGPRSPSK